jgi:hypothetical protein
LKGLDRAGQVKSMYEAAFARTPTREETAASIDFLERQGELHGGTDGNGRALADLAQVLFNVKEFLFLN